LKIITRKENMVYREIRYMQLDLNTPVSEDMLKRNLDLPEHEYHDTITALENKGLISRKDGRIVAENLDEEVKVMETQEDVRVAELNQIEEEALRILRETGGGASVPRYILEGHLLYGPLKLGTRRMYNVILSLENRGLLERVQLDDGEYYRPVMAQGNED